MYTRPPVYDHQIVAINRGKKDNESSSIVYKDKRGELHVIDLDQCASNFQAENPNVSEPFLGDCRSKEGLFIFCTGGHSTILRFKRLYIFGNRLFEKMIAQTPYTFYDWS